VEGSGKGLPHGVTSLQLQLTQLWLVVPLALVSQHFQSDRSERMLTLNRDTAALGLFEERADEPRLAVGMVTWGDNESVDGQKIFGINNASSSEDRLLLIAVLHVMVTRPYCCLHSFDHADKYTKLVHESKTVVSQSILNVFTL